MGLLTQLPTHKGSRELKPYAQKDRPKCPFYGFNGMYGMFMDSEGNQCALITDSFSPCQMEMAEKTPSWSECPFNTEEKRKDLASVARKMKVFPKGFHPPKQRS